MWFHLVVECFAQDEFVFAEAERVGVDGDRLDVHVTVLSRRLPRARSVKVPDRQLCQISSRKDPFKLSKSKRENEYVAFAFVSI